MADDYETKLLELDQSLQVAILTIVTHSGEGLSDLGNFQEQKYQHCGALRLANAAGELFRNIVG